MVRYEGQPLPPSPRIALMANDALGNFAICTPIARGLRTAYPNCIIDFFGGERTAELEAASIPTLFAWRTSVHGKDLEVAVADANERINSNGDYHLVINIEVGAVNRELAARIAGANTFVCGPCLAADLQSDWDFPADERGDLWRDKAWVAEDLVSRYPFLTTGFIGELFYQLAYIPPISDSTWAGGLPRYEFPTEAPPFDTPSTLIACGASLPEKLWPVSKWRELLQTLSSPPGLLGAPPKRQREFYHSDDDEQSLVDEGLAIDLRGKLTLPQVVGALAKASLVVTLDNGILHFAAANDVRTVGLYRRGIHRLWAPPNPNLTVVIPNSGNVSEIPVSAVLAAVGDR